MKTKRHRQKWLHVLCGTMGDISYIIFSPIATCCKNYSHPTAIRVMCMSVLYSLVCLRSMSVCCVQTLIVVIYTLLLLDEIRYGFGVCVVFCSFFRCCCCCFFFWVSAADDSASQFNSKHIHSYH